MSMLPVLCRTALLARPISTAGRCTDSVRGRAASVQEGHPVGRIQRTFASRRGLMAADSARRHQAPGAAMQPYGHSWPSTRPGGLNASCCLMLLTRAVRLLQTEEASRSYASNASLLVCSPPAAGCSKNGVPARPATALGRRRNMERH